MDEVLANHVLASLADEEREQLRPTSLAKMRLAVGALLADLLDLHHAGGPGREPPAGMRGASPKDFNARQLGFGRSIFLSVTRHMASSGLLQITVGKPRWLPAFETFVVRGGDMTTYRLTPKALSLVDSVGINLSTSSAHWRLVRDEQVPIKVDTPLVGLRSKRKQIRGKKQQPRDLPVDWSDPRVQKIVKELTDLNTFLAKQQIGGMALIGLRRIFNNGDQHPYEWDKGGRFYSLPGGHLYESRGSHWRRSVITINGEAVDEVDLRASHLTLLHALLRQPFDTRRDPYGIPEWPRAVVKAWVSQAIGSGNPRPTQWSRDAQGEYEKERTDRWLQDEFAVREVGAAVTARHPLLADLRVCGIGPLDLMFHEAEILRLAMEDLMLKQGIPVLPMHDALIAPRSALTKAQEALERAFGTHVVRVTGHPSLIVPKISCKGESP